LNTGNDGTTALKNQNIQPRMKHRRKNTDLGEWRAEIADVRIAFHFAMLAPGTKESSGTFGFGH
jgi:hypothetical protein